MNRSIALLGILLSAAPIPWPEGETEYREGEADCAKPLPEGTFTVTGLKVSWEAVDLAEGIFGPSPIKEIGGDAHSGSAGRCWAAADGDGTILYVARGEVHGELRILGEEVLFPGRAECPKSKLVTRKLATANGLRLGLTRQQVERKLGQASRAGTGWYEKACFSKKPMSDAEKTQFKASPGYTDLFIGSSVRVLERDGKAIGFLIAWSESY